MSDALIARYQQGGDIYNTLAGRYGSQSADVIAQAALSGDPTQVNAALVQVKFGDPLETSTSHIFLDQLLTDPLGAPLEAADKGINQIFASTTGKVVVVASILLIATILVVKLK